MNKYCKDIRKYTFSEEVKQICKPLSLIGINGFFYIRGFKSGDFINLSTNPAINTIFFEKFYALKYKPEDIAEHILNSEKMIFSEFNMHSEIWQEAKNFFELGSAILISKKIDDFFETFCFCLDIKSKHSGEFFLTHRHLLEQFMRYFHERAKHLIECAQKDKFIMPDFYKVNNDIIKNESSIKEFINVICAQGIDLGEQLKNAKITRKEAQCLYWISEGKTIEEVSIILGNSPRTIETHVNKIKEKLHCSKLTKLTEKIYQMNLNYLLSYWRRSQ